MRVPGLRALKHTAKLHYMNARGWRSDRKIVVMESDDWGAVRMASREARSKLQDFGLDLAKCHYTSLDALESEKDLSALFEVLTSVRNVRGQHPKMTANVLVANPDFDKIKEADFQAYYLEYLPDTLAKYPEHAGVLDMWKEGVERKIFRPQLHGREHLNVARWMSALQSDSKDTRLAFDLGVFALSTTVTSEKRASYLAAFDPGAGGQSVDYRGILEDAAGTFERLLGYPSRSFIAPNYVWNEEVEAILHPLGIRYLQGGRVQQYPTPAGGKAPVAHYLGQRNKLGQIYLLRNCHFEPSSQPNKNWIDSCLREVEVAFRWKKPAVISTHRVNFIGFIEPSNRETNLQMFRKLLKQIVQRWPEVEFLSSDELGQAIENHEQ